MTPTLELLQYIQPYDIFEDKLFLWYSPSYLLCRDVKYTDAFIYEFSEHWFHLKKLCSGEGKSHPIYWVYNSKPNWLTAYHFPHRAKELIAGPVGPHPVKNKYALLQEKKQNDPGSSLIFLASLISHTFAPSLLHKGLLVSPHSSHSKKKDEKITCLLANKLYFRLNKILSGH